LAREKGKGLFADPGQSWCFQDYICFQWNPWIKHPSALQLRMAWAGGHAAVAAFK
jgi:hypothetical protein